MILNLNSFSALYLVFAFEKMKTSWDASGKPLYTPLVSKSKNKRKAEDNEEDEGESSIKSKRHKENETT